MTLESFQAWDGTRGKKSPFLIWEDEDSLIIAFKQPLKKPVARYRKVKKLAEDAEIDWNKWENW